MPSDQVILERAKKIDPCAFKSYSGSDRRDAQHEAIQQARAELAAEAATPQQRRYSIDEIDRMRKALGRVQPWNYMNRDLKPSVEDQLRTAMLGGVTAQELEDRAALYWEAIRQRREAKQAMVREQEEAAASVPAGGSEQAMRVAGAAREIVKDIPLTPFWYRTLTARVEAALWRLGWHS
jgi:DNA-binding transcriptional regulator YdaS (Cro superfamily)